MSKSSDDFTEFAIGTLGSTVVDGRLYVSADDLMDYMVNMHTEVLQLVMRNKLCRDGLTVSDQMIRAVYRVSKALESVHQTEVPDHIPDDIIGE